MPTPLFQQDKPRSLGVLNPVRSRQLDAARFGGVVNGQPQAFNPNPVRTPNKISYKQFLAQNPNSPAATGSLSDAPRALPNGPVATAPATPGQNVLQPVRPAIPDLTGVDPSSFQAQNTLANAGIYQPGSFGAQNATANGTGYKPPQQTERANPLSGDNNIPMESTTTRVAAPPFIQRGRTVPTGQDVAPKPSPTPTQDIGGAINDTQKSIRTGSTFTGGTGKFARSFSNQASAGHYDNFVRQLFPDLAQA